MYMTDYRHPLILSAEMRYLNVEVLLLTILTHQASIFQIQSIENDQNKTNLSFVNLT